MEKRGPSHTIGGNVNLVQLLWKTEWIFLKKLKIELSYDIVIPLLGIYPFKTIIKKDTCTSYNHRSTIYNSQSMEGTKCPSTDEWVKKIWYMHAHVCTHTQDYHSAIKKYKIIMLNEVRKRKTNTTWYHLYTEFKG